MESRVIIMLGLTVEIFFFSVGQCALKTADGEGSDEVSRLVTLKRFQSVLAFGSEVIKRFP